MPDRAAAVPLPPGFRGLEPEPEPQFLTVDDVAAPSIRDTGAGTDDSDDSSETSLPAAPRVGGVSGAARPMTLAELAAQPAPVAPGTHFRCVRKAAVRAGFELESQRLGFLEPGEEIEVLETRVNDRRKLRVRYEGGWTSIESAAGAVLLVNMQPHPADPPALSQWAVAAISSGFRALDRDVEREVELESENPAFSAHLQEMELASRLLAEGGELAHSNPLRTGAKRRVDTAASSPGALLPVAQTTKRLPSALARCSSGTPTTTRPREGFGRLKRAFSSFCKRSYTNG